MKINFLLFFVVLVLFISNSGISQVIQNPKTLISDPPIESKLNYAAWRVDYYI